MIARTFTLNPYRQLVAPRLEYLNEMFAWARQYPSMYRINPNRTFTYTNQQALNWLLLTWD